MDCTDSRFSGLDYSEQCTMEARRLFKDGVYKALKKRIKPRVKLTYIHDDMVVQILDETGGELYRHMIKDVNRVIYFGASSETIAGTITSEFRKTVLKKYFKAPILRTGR